MNLQKNRSTLNYEAGYHKHRHSNHSNKIYYEARAKVSLIKFFKNIDFNNTKILDFGCGMGQNIYFIPNATGYDISQYGLEFCRSKGLKVTNDLEEINDEGFDLVFSSHVLEHHPNPMKMIDDIKTKLKPGKKLILVIPYERHGKGKFELDLNQHLFNWNFQNINNLLIVSGFRIIQNSYLRGAGYSKLLFLYKINFNLYYFATNLLSRLFGIKEMLIVATKIN